MHVSVTMKKSFSNLKGTFLDPGDRVTILRVGKKVTKFTNDCGRTGTIYNKELLDYFEAWWK